MRFLMLNWRDPVNPISGGAERVSLAHLRTLIERGHEVWWFANDFKNAAREETFQDIKIVRGGGKGSSIMQARSWYRRQKPFDLVIDQHHGLPWFAPWWAKTNCVAYIHEVLGPIWKAFYPWPLSALGACQERWTHRLYGKVPFWTPSESTKKDLHRNGVRDVTVIPNGSDTVPLAQLEENRFQLPLQLILVSRLAPNKRIDHAIRVTQLLNQRNVPTQLTVVGTGESEAELKALAQSLQLGEKVRFTGAVSEAEKNSRLQQAHFLIHTSIREGWGLNVIEANAVGTPAAVYPVGGLVDSTVPGKTGIISAQDTPESLADALAAAAKSPENYSAYRVNAWERSKTFSWKIICPQIADWLEAHARKKPGANS
jgi:glycosyltransferase involved in cell wall biosynthesis